MDDIKKYWDLVVSWGKQKISYLILLAVIVLVILVTRSTGPIVFIKAGGDQKIKIEVYDDFVDSIAVEDTLGMSDFLADKSYTPKLIKNVAWHTTASAPTARKTTKKDWENFFYNEKYPGYRMVGYNYLVERDGTIIYLRPINRDSVLQKSEVVWGVANANSTTVSIAYVGGVVKTKGKYIAADTRTKEQKQTLDSLTRDILTFAKKASVSGHRDFKGVKKSCPNFDVKKEFK